MLNVITAELLFHRLARRLIIDIAIFNTVIMTLRLTHVIRSCAFSSQR